MRAGISTGLVAATALLLAACGSTSDSDRIRSVLRDVAAHPMRLCDSYATSAMMLRAGGVDACRRAAAAPDATDPALRVLRVKVTGVTATALVRGRGGTNTISLTKLGSDWKVSNAG